MNYTLLQVGTIVALPGIFMIFAAVCGWNWLFELGVFNRGLWGALSKDGKRIAYGIIGVVTVTIGLLIATGLIEKLLI
jgi:hypothetical protein